MRALPTEEEYLSYFPRIADQMIDWFLKREKRLHRRIYKIHDKDMESINAVSTYISNALGLFHSALVGFIEINKLDSGQILLEFSIRERNYLIYKEFFSKVPLLERWQFVKFEPHQALKNGVHSYFDFKIYPQLIEFSINKNPLNQYALDVCLYYQYEGEDLLDKLENDCVFQITFDNYLQNIVGIDIMNIRGINLGFDFYEDRPPKTKPFSEFRGDVLATYEQILKARSNIVFPEDQDDFRTFILTFDGCDYENLINVALRNWDKKQAYPYFNHLYFSFRPTADDIERDANGEPYNRVEEEKFADTIWAYVMELFPRNEGNIFVESQIGIKGKSFEFFSTDFRKQTQVIDYLVAHYQSEMKIYYVISSTDEWGSYENGLRLYDKHRED